jgi:hypothetical protein
MINGGRKCEYPQYFKGICHKKATQTLQYRRRSPAYWVWVCDDHVEGW